MPPVPYDVAACCEEDPIEESVVRGESRAEFAALYRESLDETVRQG